MGIFAILALIQLPEEYMNTEKVINALRNSFPYELTDDQQNAIEKISSFLIGTSGASLFLLRGYAGTGKTTLVSSLVNVLPMINKDFVLLAPTGRAAKVISLYTGKKAFTIHKKLYRLQANSEGIISFTRMINKHKNTLFVVDEASMINTRTEQDEGSLFGSKNLLDDLVEYVYSGQNCKLMLIGDDAQLPPVHMDQSPALDIKHLKAKYSLDISFATLSRVVRQSYESGILYNATLIRNKVSNPGKAFPKFKLDGFGDVKRLQGWELEEAVIDAFTGSQKEKSIIICRSNKRANLYNQQIRNRVLYFEEELSGGDYLMATRNNYFWLPESSEAGFIANGDMMELLRVKTIEECYGFRFADVSVRLIDYPDEPVLDVKLIIDSLMIDKPSLSFKDLSKLYEEISMDYSDIPEKRKRYLKIKQNEYYNALQVKFAYALTCHKSQGGQWENVFVEMGMIPNNTPDREFYRWLYTALTRATKNLYLMNFTDEFFD